MNAPTPALVARPERLRLVGQRRQILAVVHQRLMLGMLVYVGIIGLIVLRILWLAAFGDHAGRKVGVTSLVPDRGDIVDRDGQPLARTIDAWTIALHPKKIIGDKLDLANRLAVLMPEKDAVQYLAMMRSDKPFFYLRRRAAPDVVQAVNALGRARPGDRPRARPALSADQPRRARHRLHRHRRPRQSPGSSARSTSSSTTRRRAASRSPCRSRAGSSRRSSMNCWPR